MAIINQVVSGGGSAPAHYVEKAVDANGKLLNSTNIINLTGVTDIGSYALAYDYYGVSFPANANIDLSSLTTISGDHCCYYMFYGCGGLTSVDLSGLTTVSATYGCGSMFQGCTNLTSMDISSLTTVSGTYCCQSMFEGCAGLTSVDLSGLTTISGAGYACSHMFKSCTGLTSVDLSGLTTVSSNSGCRAMFIGCTGLTSVVWSGLTTVSTSNAYQYMFQDCRNLTSLSFPSITPNSFGSYANQFSGMCFGISGIVIHFPSNTQAKIETLQGYSATAPFGANSGTVLFDLPATNTLTGADTVTYTRNPKYDTATALAWKVGAYGTTNFTPAYYTSGTSDPQANDTIYSDAACTTAVTTISAIA